MYLIFFIIVIILFKPFDMKMTIHICFFMKEVIERNTDLVNKLLLTRNVPVNKLLLTGTLSNVHRCWLAMPLGAGVLHWVLACRTILVNVNLVNPR